MFMTLGLLLFLAREITSNIPSMYVDIFPCGVSITLMGMILAPLAIPPNVPAAMPATAV